MGLALGLAIILWGIFGRRFQFFKPYWWPDRKVPLWAQRTLVIGLGVAITFGATATYLK